jgi:tRNA threonylcarbamoyladenosine biosynthesis protein TsaE
MVAHTICLDLPSPDATSRFAQAIAARLVPGDVILLEGPIGAGKTHFARALIHARQAADGAPPEDVPSPTFTLVQTYETPTTEIWHADLYRLTHPDEVEELGLADAFDTAICLVEWPDRLWSLAPAGALTLSFRSGETPESRLVHASAKTPRWQALLESIKAEFGHVR